jgi:hypothetical protein
MYVYYQADYDIELWVILSQLANTDPDIVQWSAFRKEYHFWMLIIWGTLAAASVELEWASLGGLHSSEGYGQPALFYQRIDTYDSIGSASKRPKHHRR